MTNRPVDTPETTGGTLSTRWATREDNARLCELFAEVTMESDLHLAVERDPDFFALYDVQVDGPDDIAATVLECDGRIEGLGTVLGRDGYVGGVRQRIGYAGDLRMTRRVRGGEFLTQHYGQLVDRAGTRLGTRLMYTAIITSNRRAVAALTRRQQAHETVPVYTEFSRFRITNVQFTGRKRPRPSGLSVRPATTDDLPDIAALLAEQHQRRAFGWVIDQTVLEHRLATWPGLSLANFILAFDGSRLVGVTATWDAWDLKRYRVLGYYRSMRLVRLGYNLAAPFWGATRLPAPGGLLRYFYLTHTAVRGDDPAIMQALVDAVYAVNHGRGYHFFSTCLVDNDPLASAFSRYQVTALPAALYTVTRPQDPVPLDALQGVRPGFEMALV